MARELHPEVMRSMLAASGRLRVEFGQDSALNQPGGYRYEISEADRRVLEQAVADSSGSDPTIAAAAFDALKMATAGVPPLNLAIRVGEFVWNILGKLFDGAGSLSAGALVVRGTGGCASAGRSLLRSQDCYGAAEKFGWSVSDGTATLHYKIVTRVASYEYTYADGGTADFQAAPGSFAVQRVASDGTATTMQSISAPNLSISLATHLSTGDYDEDLATARGFSGMEDDEKSGEATLTFGVSSSETYRVCCIDSDRDCDAMQPTPRNCKDLPSSGSGEFGDTPQLDSLADTGAFGDPADSDLTPTETRNFIDRIKGSPWNRDYGPGANDPTNPEPITEPPGNDPPATTPPSLDAPGGEPLPSPPPPGVEPLPQEPAPGGPPPGFSGPGGGHLKLPPPEAGGPDPWDDRYQPGNPICFVQDGVKKCGKIRRYKPPDVEFDNPPYGDQEFGKPWCKPKGTRINSMIRELALELGMNPNLAVVDSCVKRWPGGCYPKGKNKLDALWDLQDKCGFGVYDPPGGGTEIGPITPLPVYWDFHEHKNLVSLTPVSEDSELYRKVVVFKRRRNGSILEVPVTVAGTSLLPEDRQLRRAVPRGTSEADMLDLAQNLADRIALKTKTVEFEVPLNLRLAARHQVTFRMPSLGFTARYMVWPDSIEHSYEAIDSFWSTKGRAVELDRYRYSRRFEYIP